MSKNASATASSASSFALWGVSLGDLGQLLKLRLNLTVVFSTFIGYLLGSTTETFNWVGLIVITIGGFLTVGAANGINQIIEKDIDAKMVRTENRPVAAGRISTTVASIICLIMGVLGVGMIAYYLNFNAALLSLISLALYAFVYTPLKQVTPLAVHIGAIPGALPPLIGYVAAANQFGFLPGALFAIQFIWQFPHFYSIGWMLNDDYQRAGLKMHPIGTKDGVGKAVAVQIFYYTLAIIPFSILPIYFGYVHWIPGLLLVLAGLYLCYRSYELLEHKDYRSAKRLMLGSILYLPIIFLILLLNKAF